MQVFNMLSLFSQAASAIYSSSPIIIVMSHSHICITELAMTDIVRYSMVKKNAGKS